LIGFIVRVTLFEVDDTEVTEEHEEDDDLRLVNIAVDCFLELTC
jgi:hypothetical protein